MKAKQANSAAVNSDRQHLPAPQPAKVIDFPARSRQIVNERDAIAKIDEALQNRPAVGSDRSLPIRLRGGVVIVVECPDVAACDKSLAASILEMLPRNGSVPTLQPSGARIPTISGFLWADGRRIEYLGRYSPALIIRHGGPCLWTNARGHNDDVLEIRENDAIVFFVDDLALAVDSKRKTTYPRDRSIVFVYRTDSPNLSIVIEEFFDELKPIIYTKSGDNDA